MAESSGSSSISTTDVEVLEDSSCPTEDASVRKILNTLKSPTPFQLARKRKTHSNPPMHWYEEEDKHSQG